MVITHLKTFVTRYSTMDELRTRKSRNRQNLPPAF